MTGKIYRFGDFELDVPKHQLRKTTRVNDIEPQVFRLLQLLIENRDRVVSRDEIIEDIWGGRAISDAAVTSRVRSARAAIGDDGRTQRWIKTIHGVGFRFVGDVTTVPMPSDDGRIANRETVTAVLVRPAESSDAPTAVDKIPFAVRTAQGWSRKRAALVWSGIAMSLFLFASYFTVLKPSDRKVALRLNTEAQIAIAILPYQDFTGSNDSAYLALSLAERVNNRLSARPSLAVTSQTSAKAIAARSGLTTQEIGALLDIDYLLEGSLNQDGDQIMLTNRLIKVDTDTIVWTKDFERRADTASLIAVEKSLADAVSDALGLDPTSNPELEWETDSPSAYEAMALGDYYAGLPRSLDNIENAIAAYADAITYDPDLGAAYASRSVQRFHKAFVTEEPNEFEVIVEPAEADMQRSKALDRNGPRSRFAEAFSYVWYLNDGDQKTARRLLRQVIEDYPLFLPSYEHLAEAIMHSKGSPADARAAIDFALSRDPLNADLLAKSAELYLVTGNVSEAVRVSRKNYEWNPTAHNALRMHTIVMDQAKFHADAYAALKSEIELGTQDFYTTNTAIAWTMSLEGLDAAQALRTTELAEITYAALSSDKAAAMDIISDFEADGTLNAVGWYPFLAEFGAPEAVYSERGVLDWPAEAFAYDHESEFIYWAQESFFEGLIVAMTIVDTDRPQAEAVSQKLQEDLAYLRTQDFMHTSLPYFAAAWYTMIGDFDAAIDWLDLHSGQMRYPIGTMLDTPVFEPLRSRADFKSVRDQYDRNAADTLARYEAKKAVSR